LLAFLEEESSRNLILPAICCMAVGGNPGDAVPVSAAWVALNLAGHLMDAVQDEDELYSEVVKTPVEAISFFVGLLFLAFHFLDSITQPVAFRRVHSIFSEAYFRASTGQFLGFTKYEKLPLDDALEKYWQATISKAGNIFQAATAGGAAVGMGSEAQIAALGNYGLALGTILQILDDCRDVLDESETMATYEISLPLLLYYAASPQGKTLPVPTDRKELLRRLDGVHVQDMIADVLANWRGRALSSLQSLEDSGAVEQLKVFIDRILAQKKG
jgi:geranylgeranyl pyrophosphate synthase